MATVTISFTHPQASYSRTFTVPDAHLARFVQALKSDYAPDDLTNAEALERYTSGMVRGMKDLTRRVETQDAEQTARLGVSEITAT